MSLDTWKQQYLTDNQAGSMKEAAGDALTATRHSIHKWIGLQRGRLKEHAVHHHQYMIVDDVTDTKLSIDFATCALCSYASDASGAVTCSRCPLYTLLGKECDDEDSAYSVWCADGNALLMIQDLLTVEAAIKKMRNIVD